METLNRRSFLIKAGATIGLLGAGGSLLAACGGGSANPAAPSSAPGSAVPSVAASNAAKKLGQWTIQMNWLVGAGWAGSYLANEAGVYQKVGFDQGLNILYGGPTVAVEPIIESGKALMGICNSETFAGAIKQGAKLVAVGAYLQRNPFCITSLPDKPIKTPQDMIGKKIATQALNDTLWSALLKINNIPESAVIKVVSQNDPTPLANGEVDGFLSFVTNQPVTLSLKGFKPVNMMLADFGFTLYQQLYAVSQDTLKNKRDAVVAGLKAEIIGKQLLAANADKGVDLTVNKYGKGENIDPVFSKRAVEGTLALADTPYTRDKGLMYMSPEDIDKNVATLKLLGLEIPSTVYTDSVLDEIYAGGTKLS